MEYLCCWTSSKSWFKDQSKEQRTCKLAVVGDVGSGKTSLIFKFSRDRLPCSGEMKSSLETDLVDVKRDGRSVLVAIHDTAGDEEYAKLRALTYNQVDAIIICLPLDSPKSLRCLELDWSPELRHLCKMKPYILVGTKKDLRDKTSHTNGYMGSFISEKQGKKYAKTLGAVAYLECSAFDNDGGKSVKRVFGRVIREALKHQS